MPRPSSHQRLALQPSRRSTRLQLRQQQQQQQQRQDQHPLIIPELLNLIASFVDRRTILSCIRVSKTWNSTFLPFIYHTITFSSDEKYPPPSTLLKHASLINDLSVVSEPSLDNDKSAALQQPINLTCPRLTVLQIDQRLDKTLSRASTEAMIGLVQRHQTTLTCLLLDSVTSSELLDAVQGCDRLVQLGISYLLLDTPRQWMKYYKPLWSRLKVLTLGGPWFRRVYFKDELGAGTATGLQPQNGSDSNNNNHLNISSNNDSDASNDLLRGDQPTFIQQAMHQDNESKVQRLTFHTTQRQGAILQLQAFFVSMSPELAQLSWSVHDRSTHLSPPMEMLTINTLSKHLLDRLADSLDLIELPASDFQNENLRILLRALKKLSRLHLQATPFDSESWTILKEEIPRYRTTLRSLNVRACDRVTGAMIQDILCSMPALEVFAADFLQDLDLSADAQRPWVCQRLRRLTMGFVLNGDPVVNGQGEEHRPGQGPVEIVRGDQLVFSRLAELEQLELLNVSMWFLNGRYNRSDLYRQVEGVSGRKRYLSLKLEHGMALLKNLRRLKRLDGPHSDQVAWTTNEAAWVMKHWVSLEDTTGIHLDGEAFKLLKANGVKPMECNCGPSYFVQELWIEDIDDDDDQQQQQQDQQDPDATDGSSDDDNDTEHAVDYDDEDALEEEF
ncbi:hypothetical protein BGZ83_008462 [Gryganskiella cystojenkinii]|nr:hypothetical protein BGZ83_008462 [Gryganskiella cystojenkinii]